MTYLGFLVVFLLPPIGVLAAASRTRNIVPEVPDWQQAAALGVLTVLALAATVPWDAALIAAGTWTYPHGQLLRWVAGVPAEEWLFILGQPLLVGLWLRNLSPLSRPAVIRTGTTVRTVGAGLWLAVAASGAVLATRPPTSYLGLVGWAGPVLALQSAVGGDQLRRLRRLVGVAASVPALYLCAVDRLALNLELWQLSPTRTTGLRLLGLPLEEALFFTVTTLIVTRGLLLAVSPVVLRRLRILVPGQHRGTCSPAAPAPFATFVRLPDAR